MLLASPFSIFIQPEALPMGQWCSHSGGLFPPHLSLLWECPTGTLKVGSPGIPDSVWFRVKRSLTDHYRHCQSTLGYSWWQGSQTGHFPPPTGEGRSARDHHVAHSFGGWLKKPELFKMSVQEIQQSWTGDHSPSGTTV